jgi:hypothetical protein
MSFPAAKQVGTEAYAQLSGTEVKNAWTFTLTS